MAYTSAHHIWLRTARVISRTFVVDSAGATDAPQTISNGWSPEATRKIAYDNLLRIREGCV